MATNSSTSDTFRVSVDHNIAPTANASLAPTNIMATCDGNSPSTGHSNTYSNEDTSGLAAIEESIDKLLQGSNLPALDMAATFDTIPISLPPLLNDGMSNGASMGRGHSISYPHHTALRGAMAQGPCQLGSAHPSNRYQLEEYTRHHMHPALRSGPCEIRIDYAAIEQASELEFTILQQDQSYPGSTDYFACTTQTCQADPIYESSMNVSPIPAYVQNMFIQPDQTSQQRHQHHHVIHHHYHHYVQRLETSRLHR